MLSFLHKDGLFLLLFTMESGETESLCLLDEMLSTLP